METSSTILAISVLIEKGIIIRNEKGELMLNKKAISDQKTGQQNGLEVTRKLVRSDQKTGQSDQKTGQSECNILRDSIEIGEIGERPPTFSEIAGYCTENKKTIDPCKFFEFYSSRGWCKGSNPISNWRAVVDEWEATEYQDKAKQPKAQPSPTVAVWEPSGRERIAAIERVFHAKAIINNKCSFCGKPENPVIGCDCAKYSAELDKVKNRVLSGKGA